jgi:hypothetical protein
MAETAIPARRTKWKRGVFVSLISLSVCLLCAELLVRATVGAPRREQLPLALIRAHPTRGWEMVPNESHFTYGHRVHVNSLGFRGPEVPLEKGIERRVLCVGDSHVYGQGVADDQTIPGRLEALANAGSPSRSLRAINAGVRAYATNQEIALVEEFVPRVKPDVVALFWYHNDFEERDIAQTYSRLAASGPIVFDLRAPMSDRVAFDWKVKQALRRSALLMWALDAWRGSDEIEFPREFYEEGFTRLGVYAERLIALSSQYGFQAIFVLVPNRSGLPGPGPYETRERRALEVARKKGLTVVDPLPELRELYKRTRVLPVIPHDGHYEGPANEAIARALLANLPP